MQTADEMAALAIRDHRGAIAAHASLLVARINPMPDGGTTEERDEAIEVLLVALEHRLAGAPAEPFIDVVLELARDRVQRGVPRSGLATMVPALIASVRRGLDDVGHPEVHACCLAVEDTLLAVSLQVMRSLLQEPEAIRSLAGVEATRASRPAASPVPEADGQLASEQTRRARPVDTEQDAVPPFPGPDATD